MAHSPVGVSQREAEVLAAVAERLSNAEIAAKLYISVRTVESHVSSLLRKFGVDDRWELIERAAVPGPAGVVGLPAAWTTLVGRAAERHAIRATLGQARLVSLVGPGGVGKTRLAAAVAEAAAASFAAGASYVDLVPVRGDFVAQAVATVLGAAESPQQPLPGAIAARIGRGRALLVLDNCEHLLAPVADLVTRLLSACPNLRVLATSRERLGVVGERVVPVQPLAADTEAVALFRDRAADVDPGFAADPAVLAGLCLRLDGLPLAIELAAARCGVLGIDGLAQALDDALDLLSGRRGSDPRHHSLRAVMEWSHHLLDERTRTLFRRLAVFAGSVDLAAVAAVTGGDRTATAAGLGRLVDKSLLVHEPHRGRWRLLTTVRAFASEQLDASGERAAVTDRYVRWAAATAVDLLDAPAGDFELVAGDLRAAVRCGAHPVCHELARTLGRLTFTRRFLRGAVDHFRLAAEYARTAADAAADLRSAAGCAFVSTTSGPDTMTLQLAAAERTEGTERAVALCAAATTSGRYQVIRREETSPDTERLLGDAADAFAAGDRDEPLPGAELAVARAWTVDRGSVEAARAAVTAAHDAGDPVLASTALDAVWMAVQRAGRYRDLPPITRQRSALVPAMDPDDPVAVAEIVDIAITTCVEALFVGDLPAALDTARRLPDLLGARSYVATGLRVPALVLTGDLDAAVHAADLMWAGWEQSGRAPSGWMIPPVAMAALAHLLRRDRDGFSRWRNRAAGVAGTADASRVAALAFLDARAAVHTGALLAGTPHPFGELTHAAELVDQAFGDSYTWPAPYARAAGAELAVLAGLPDAERRLTAARPAAAHNSWAAACLARATARHTGDPDAYTRSLTRWTDIGARVDHAETLLLLPGRRHEGMSELDALTAPGS